MAITSFCLLMARQIPDVAQGGRLDLRLPHRSLCLFFAVLLAAAPLSADDKAAKRAELEQLRQRISELQQQLEQVRNRHDELRQQLSKVEQRVGRLSGSILRLERELDERQQRLKKLRSQEGDLQRSVAAQRGYLANQVRASYAMGRQEYLKILLNQEDPATLSRISTYYDYLNKARSERIRQLGKSIKDLEQVRTAGENEARRLREIRNIKAQEKTELQASRKEREKVLAQLKEEINSKDQRLAAMLQDEQELKSLLSALADALEDIPAEPGNHKAFASLKGHLNWPAKGKLLVSYGSPRKLGKLRWMGVMIDAKQGQEVKAVSHGRVAFSNWLRGYGMLVIVDHGDGYMSLYGRNQTLYVEAGDWVESGQVIASVGDSGGAEKSGLYFEIRKNGRPTDPVRWCRR